MDASTPGVGGSFGLRRELLGALPIIDHFVRRIGLDALLDTYVPTADARTKLAPSKSLSVLVRNLVVHREPVYAIGEWAGRYDPSVLGLEESDVGLFNDDRLGRALGLLFDADRASLLTRLVTGAINRFDIDVSQVHNDSTSVKFTGSYKGADGSERGGKRTVALARGHSKDHRPDLKQLVFILTVSGDGAVPIAHQVAPGNTEDSTTHIQTWDTLCKLLGRHDFLYVADCKLATRKNMVHIDSSGGRFVTVLPRTRKEDEAFRTWVVDHEPEWQEAMSKPGRHRDDPDDVYSTTEAPWPSAEGFPVTWVHSSTKEANDANSRQDRIAAGIAALDELNQRFSSPKTRTKTKVAAEVAATGALAATGSSRWVRFEIEEVTEVHHRQESRGRPGANTRYRQVTRTYFRARFSVDEALVARDARSDGCWPLVSNARELSGKERLAVYKHQPYLERRNGQFKGDQLVAPVFTQDPARIEGLMACHFIALLIQALIELEVRRAMERRRISSLPLYPEDRACPAPSAARIIEIFEGVVREHLYDRDGEFLQTFSPELTPIQTQLLDLLGVPTDRYR
jgi:transposase